MELKLIGRQEHVSGSDLRPIGPCLMKCRAVVFVLLCLLPTAFLAPAMRRVAVLVVNDQTYSQIPLIPAISVYLIYTWRDLIFKRIGHAWKSGSAFVLSGTVSLVLARINPFNLIAANQNSLLIFGFVLLCIGMFLLCFGPQSFRAAMFPLFFLFFYGSDS